MPYYRFCLVTPSGDVDLSRFIEPFYRMSEAPEFGSELDVDGARWRRVPCSDVTVMPLGDAHFTAVSLPIHDPDAPRSNEHGEPQFANRGEVLDWLAKKDHKGKPMTYDRPGFQRSRPQCRG